MKSQPSATQCIQAQPDPALATAWVSRSVRVEDTSPLGFLRQHPNEARFFFDNGHQPLTLAACGQAAFVTAQGTQRFASIRQQLHALSNRIVRSSEVPEAAQPRWFGGFSFRSRHHPDGVWKRFPAARFVLPRRQLACVNGQTWLTLTDALGPRESVRQAQRRLDHEARQCVIPRAGSTPPPCAVGPIRLEWLMTRFLWRSLVESATDRIRRNALEKVVLAQPCRLQLTASIDPVDVLCRLKHAYPTCYRFLVAPQPGQAFLGATPELLARVAETQVETVAMASSIRRGQTPEEDRALAEKLMHSAKERHEHAVVVHAIAKRLAPLTQSLEVSNTPEIVRFHNIQHLQTKIQGTLSTPCGVLPVVEALHPTPAMGGTPRQAALAFIEQFEPFQRGWYASPVGWVDLAGNGLFAVAIRSAVLRHAQAHLFAGAGIVADSDPDREWAEVQLKFRPMLEALGQPHALGRSKTL